MSRTILYVCVAIITFVVGVATNRTVNTFGRFAVDQLYADASIPSLSQANPSDVGTLNRMPLASWRCRANVVNRNR